MDSANLQIMKNLETRLKIGVIEPDKEKAEWIKKSFDSQKNVDTVEIIQSENELLKRISDGSINTIIINIFNYGISKGIGIIEGIKGKAVPVCLLGTDVQIKYFPDVPDEWIKKLKSYCKIVINISRHDLGEEIKRMAKSLFHCREEMVFGKKLEDIKRKITKDSNISNDVNVKDLLMLSKKAITLASDQGKEINKLSSDLVPGVSDKDLSELISKTLKRSSRSIKVYKWANFGIMVFGVLFISASFIGFLLEGKLGFLGLGGLGLAGIIASLVTTPIASIGRTARQMIQIQICYFSYLKQVKILNEDISSDIMQKSKRLEEVTNSLQKSLCEYF